MLNILNSDLLSVIRKTEALKSSVKKLDDECMENIIEDYTGETDENVTSKDHIKEIQTVLDNISNKAVHYEDLRSRLVGQRNRRQDNRLTPSSSSCAVCKKPLSNAESHIATCSVCNQLICVDTSCAIWIEDSSQWECFRCNSTNNVHVSASDWFIQKLTDRIGLDHVEGIMNEIQVTDQKSHHSPFSIEQREKARDLVEELVGDIVNGPVDNVTVAQITNNATYLPEYENYERSDEDHSNLKKIVQLVVEEVMKLPSILNQTGISDRPEERLPYFDPKKYEQLLATAVLNKIVESYNYEDRYRSPADLARNNELMRRKSPSPTSSVEPISDNSGNEAIIKKGKPKRNSDSSPLSSGESPEEAYLSDYLQKHKIPLPNLSDEIADDNEDLNSEWQDNWSFRRKNSTDEKNKKMAPYVSVLLPTPKDAIYAQIGDKNADEISDLSEIDDVEIEEPLDFSSYKSTEKRSSLLNNDNNEKDDQLDTGIFEPTSLISHNSTNGNDKDISEARNIYLFRPSDIEPELQSLTNDNATSYPYDSGIINPLIMSIADKVMGEENNNEVTRKIKSTEESISIGTAASKRDDSDSQNDRMGMDGTDAKNVIRSVSQFNSMTDRVDNVSSDTPVPMPRKLSKCSADSLDVSNMSSPISLDELNVSSPPLPGSIAEREHKKWLNAVQLTNNPYSPEVLEKRLSSPLNKSIIDIEKLSTPKEDNCTKVELAESSLDEDSVSLLSDKSHQISVSVRKPDQNRYGRDYYINDTERTNGTPKNKRNSGSYLASKAILNSSDEDRCGTKLTVLNQSPTNEFYTVESSAGTDTVFLAKPIRIDPELDIKCDTNGPTAKRSGSFIELSDELNLSHSSSFNDSTRFSRLSPGSPVGVTGHSDSITSEDSDVTRVYNLNSGEKRIIHSESVLSDVPSPDLNKLRNIFEPLSRTNSVSPTRVRKSILNMEKTENEIKEATSPVQPTVTVESETVINVPPVNQQNGVADTESINDLTMTTKSVIEDDVIPSLPSVKELAKSFLKSNDTNQPSTVHKPKIKLRQATVWLKPKEQTSATMNSDSEQIASSRDSYVPPYEDKYHPISVGHSITARNVSQQLLNDLKTNDETTEPSLVPVDVEPAQIQVDEDIVDTAADLPAEPCVENHNNVVEEDINVVTNNDTMIVEDNMNQMSIRDNDDEPVIENNNVECGAVDVDQEVEKTMSGSTVVNNVIAMNGAKVVETPVERPISPVLVPGTLAKTRQFFESLSAKSS